MSNYLVFTCHRCGLPRYAKEGQKNAECFGCNYQISLLSSKTRIILRTRNVTEAIEAVKRIKEKTQLLERF